MCDGKQSNGETETTEKLRLQNPLLADLEVDFLYHLGLDTRTHNLKNLFGDVKFVCMGGTKYRMREFATYMAKLLNIQLEQKPVNLTKHSHRYAMYKVGPVLSVSHGIGIPSMTVLLQEVLKLMHYAGAEDPVFFRIGTSGGVGIPPGSVVVSKWGMNGTLQKSYDLPVLGKVRQFPSYLDEKLAAELAASSEDVDGFEIHCGGTFAADDYYRGQARLDGPFCDYTTADKMAFLRQLSKSGVRNIEMEATAFAAMTKEANVRAGDVCVTLLDRLHGDQTTTPKATLLEWQTRPMIVVGRYIAQKLQEQ